jgi:hypothetical protein
MLTHNQEEHQAEYIRWRNTGDNWEQLDDAQRKVYQQMFERRPSEDDVPDHEERKRYRSNLLITSLQESTYLRSSPLMLALWRVPYNMKDRVQNPSEMMSADNCTGQQPSVSIEAPSNPTQGDDRPPPADCITKQGHSRGNADASV